MKLKGFLVRAGRSVIVLAGLMLVSGCQREGPLDAFEPGERGRVVRVIDGDALVLDTGQSVRLIGIEAPSRGRDGRPDQPYQSEAARLLEDLTLGREVRLHYAGLTRDRYDRALAHVVTDDRLGPQAWVNFALVEAGAARVRLYPDTSKGSDPLFEAETRARSQRRGLWALGAYAIEDARDIDRGQRGFVILSGVLGPRAPSDDAEASCLRDLMGSQLRVRVEASAMSTCDLPLGLRVEVRGWLSSGEVELNAAGNLRQTGEAPVALAGQ